MPEDSYAMSKVANEVTARSFQARTGADIYGLRINNVIEPHEYAELFPPFLEDPSLRRRNVFAYIDTRDLGQMVQRCLETMAWATRSSTSPTPTCPSPRRRTSPRPLLRRRRGAPRDRPHETFSAIDRPASLLGYEPQHSWRDVLADPGVGD